MSVRRCSRDSCPPVATLRSCTLVNSPLATNAMGQMKDILTTALGMVIFQGAGRAVELDFQSGCSSSRVLTCAYALPAACVISLTTALGMVIFQGVRLFRTGPTRVPWPGNNWWHQLQGCCRTARICCLGAQTSLASRWGWLAGSQHQWLSTPLPCSRAQMSSTRR